MTADIARYYHSIYTHTLAWAIHGKAVGKSRRGRLGKRLLGNRLDVAVADCQDGQTIGIPVGPDTSLVLAELLAAAVDVELLRSAKGIRGIRFIDDYEIGCRNRREADELVEALHIALGEFQLDLNPLKTTVIDLPAPLDQTWKTPIRTAQLRPASGEQATDLIALFDMGFTLARQHPEKSILAYTVGRLKDVTIAPENVVLFHRLCLQCLLSEPGTSAIVLERLAEDFRQGLPLQKDELADVLNDQIVENARVGYASEVAWALWGTLVFDIGITKRAAKAVSGVQDSVVALTALHSKARGLMDPALDTRVWQSLLTLEQLYGEQWLLAYEAPVKGWLTPSSDYIGGDANFKWLRDLGVHFYEEERAAPMAPPGAGEDPDWLLDLEERNLARRNYYGEPEPEEEPPVMPDGSGDIEELLKQL